MLLVEKGKDLSAVVLYHGDAAGLSGLKKKKSYKKMTTYFTMNIFCVELNGLLVSEAVDDVEGVADVAAEKLDAVVASMSRRRPPVGDQT